MMTPRCVMSRSSKEAADLVTQDGSDFDNDFAKSDWDILESGGELVLASDDFW